MKRVSWIQTVKSLHGTGGRYRLDTCHLILEFIHVLLFELRQFRNVTQQLVDTIKGVLKRVTLRNFGRIQELRYESSDR